MDIEVIENPEALVAFVPALSLVVKTDLPQEPASPQVKPANTPNEGQAMAMWGLNNLFPFELLADIEANAVLSAGLYWMANAIISGGLAYGYREIDPATGKPVLRQVIDPVVEDWLSKSNIAKYCREASTEFYKFWNVFPQLIFSNDHNQIAAIKCQESAFCRWGLQNAKGLIDTCYINANFDKGGRHDSAEAVKLPVLDTYYDAVGTARQQTSWKSFIYPIEGTSSGRTYYQWPPWVAVRDQGWLEVGNRVPKYTKAMLRNQFTIKYQLDIAEWWWQWKYADWDAKKELKAKRMEETLKSFNDKMKGEEGTGNSLLNAKRIIEGKEYTGWTITPLDDKLKDGKFIPDSQEATSHIFFALGLDATLIGTVPGKAHGAGSGSDKRVAMNIFIANKKAEQDIILEPVQFAFAYNNFLAPNGLPYVVWFENYWLTTLDTGKTTTTKPTPGA